MRVHVRVLCFGSTQLSECLPWPNNKCSVFGVGYRKRGNHCRAK